jgi:glycosyltransferase involved in cell wall biosynthesis
MENDNKRPFVSALLVTRNEKDYIRISLMSLIEQTYPKDKYEIIVIDGGSTDGTLDIIKELQDTYNTESFSIRVVPNPKKILATGWNIGIQSAKGEYVVRIDAHSTAEKNFIEKSVETMMRVDAVCVGGKLTSKSLNGEDNVISYVLSSPFGVGNSSFRVSENEGYADTAVYGLYKKDIFEKAGYFDEKMVRNQDIEMHSRIKKAGGKFYFNPEIRSTYYTRNTVMKMLKQAYGNGQWNMVLLKKGSGALSIRHLVPFIFVLGVIGCIILGFVHPLFWIMGLVVILLHLGLGVYFACKKTKKLSQIFTMPFLFISLHFAYGIGYIKGIFN